MKFGHTLIHRDKDQKGATQNICTGQAYKYYFYLGIWKAGSQLRKIYQWILCPFVQHFHFLFVIR